ncbi:hypothetical protein KUTeg_021405 [Tegillarca granosa]|uniref:Protein kinase domain-containing protein n=1 Tax=Tegillarca granosa TaxID=220873 RepID=A0ABQ9E355_TEGGR|nr:hypothetical protein KUTeg_021405 [Tegillarca granosa]
MAYTLDTNKLFMISELNDGENLDDVIFGEEHEGKISNEKKTEIARNVIQAVAYMHNQTPAIIHRDIKPENVLVSSDLKRTRLCDLGISKFKTMNTMVTTSDGKSIQPGTPSYQAPEVLLDHKGGSIPSDIWSLGCTILELFPEVPVWSVPPDVNPVMYIISCMKTRKQPDAMELFATKFTDNYNMTEMLYMALNYDINKRPNAFEMLKVFET